MKNAWSNIRFSVFYNGTLLVGSPSTFEEAVKLASDYAPNGHNLPPIMRVMIYYKSRLVLAFTTRDSREVA